MVRSHFYIFFKRKIQKKHSECYILVFQLCVNRYRTEKKSSPQDCVSSRRHFAPRLFLLRYSFFDRNSSARIRMALKRHTVLHRLTIENLSLCIIISMPCNKSWQKYGYILVYFVCVAEGDWDTDSKSKISKIEVNTRER